MLGRNAREGLPISVDPRIVLDNGVLSGNCVSACDKNTTFHHQNNPVIAELLRGHGTRWNFVGVVITNEPTRLAEKQLSAAAAVEKVIQMKSSGVIISKEGFGNPDADLMMIVRDLEQAGDHYIALLRRNPSNSDAHNGIGIILAKQQRWQRALRHLEQAARLDPLNVTIGKNLVYVREQIEENDQ